jgi:ElaB/YqjD/DUF883 family membrane-anchored ribosome-binding protein
VGGLPPTFDASIKKDLHMDKPTTPKAPGEDATPNVAVKEAIVETKTTVEKLKEEASSLAGDATEAARKAANQGKDKAAEALSGLSKIANDAAGTVDEHLGKTYGDYARKASASVDGVAAKLQAKNVDELAADATAFVKSRPAIAVGALAAVGLLLVGLFTGGRKKPNDQA